MTDYEMGRRDSALLAAKLIRATDWRPAERKRLRCLVRLIHTLKMRDAMHASNEEASKASARQRPQEAKGRP